ncbi:MAG: efflux RND transporter permease subunit [Bacteroidia bacterium]|nr:efflux RND transporter permease subunit [Bacteroidia bacterium]
MIMNLTGLSLKYNRITLLALAVVVILGLVEYGGLSRDSMPPFTVRIATIITQFPGASPERVESLISDKVEKVLQEIPEVNTVTSTSRTGVSIVKVTVREDVPESKLQSIWDLSRRKIENIRKDLPDGIYGPNLNDENIGVVYGIFVGLESDGFEYKELKTYADDLRDDLIALDDAAKVIIGGTVEERIYVEYNDAKLAQVGLTAGQLQNIISENNIIIPSGQVNLGEERIILESSGNFESVEAIQNLVVPVGKQGETVLLGDLANVERGYVSPKESIVRINGNQALALYVSVKDGANLIALGKDVDNLIKVYNETKLPHGINAMRIASQDKEVQKKIEVFIRNVFQSIVIVLLVILLVLGWRASIIIASMVPGTMVLTFLLMGLFDVGLNQVTLASLIMALGMLVDNGIVMVEGLLEKMQAGQSKIEASVNSAKEFMIPLLISTLTTCAAFLSFFLADGTMGDMMGNIFLIITMALLSSWLMAFTIIPLFGNALLKVTQGAEAHKTIFDYFKGPYNRLLVWALKRPVITITAITVLFFISLYGFTFIPSIFMPPSDRNLVVVDINYPLGTKIETTDSKVALLESYIKDSLMAGETIEEGILDWSSYIGKGPESYDLGYSAGEPNSSYAHMLLNTTSDFANDIVINKLRDFASRNLFDAEIKISRLVGSGGAAAPIEIRITGDDPDELFRIADRVKIKLFQTRGVINVTDDWGSRIKKIYVKIDEHKLSRAGLTNQDVAISLLTSLDGFEVGEFRDDDQSIPITMKREGSEKLAFSDIENLNVFSQARGISIPLSQVAEIEVPWQYSKILRRNLKRSLTIQAGVADGYLASNIMDEVIRPMMNEEVPKWNNGYTYEYGGDAEGSNDAMGAVIINLPLAFFIIVLLLVIQFNSFRKATIIFITIPLGIVGVTGGLLGAGSVFSFTAFLGIISLAGIIVNDAIVLIDKIGSELEKEKGLQESIKQAANDRFSPILLTTLTTSCGMVPLWTGGGALWSPMAVSIIFGLFFATIIQLIFVPAIFKLFFTNRQKDRSV